MTQQERLEKERDENRITETEIEQQTKERNWEGL